MTYANGSFVAEHLSVSGDNPIPEDRIQPNGVDLGIAEIYRPAGSSAFTDDDYERPRRLPVSLDNHPHTGPDGECWTLRGGNYIIVYDTRVSIPQGYVARVFPRSRVMRCGLHLTSALWDQGYSGRGEGMLQVPTSATPTYITHDACLAQMCFITANQASETYDGTHQGERLDPEDLPDAEGSSTMGDE